ncbi:unnamed protein product [Urochloa humidicola]
MWRLRSGMTLRVFTGRCNLEQFLEATMQVMLNYFSKVLKMLVRIQRHTRWLLRGRRQLLTRAQGSDLGEGSAAQVEAMKTPYTTY